MNSFGGGLIVVLLAGLYAEAAAQDDTILTENNLDLLAEDGRELLTEDAA